jgi:hypothetical protein
MHTFRPLCLGRALEPYPDLAYTRRFGESEGDESPEHRGRIRVLYRAFTVAIWALVGCSGSFGAWRRRSVPVMDSTCTSAWPGCDGPGTRGRSSTGPALVPAPPLLPPPLAFLVGGVFCSAQEDDWLGQSDGQGRLQL